MSFIMLFWLCVMFVVLMWTTGARTARGCTTVLVGRRASETGEVLVGHNEDSSGRYVMRTHIVPPIRRGKDKTGRFEPNLAELPLPETRAGLLWSEARCASDGDVSFCDFLVNDHGVVICSDNCSGSKEDAPELTDGGIGYGLRRLVAEEAATARQAIDIAASLLDRYGYAASGRSYHFADKDEIWVLQTMQGKHYAICRVPDDEVALVPNHYTIRQPDPEAPGYQALVDYAQKRGWYNPSEGPFDFARACQAPAFRGTVRNMHRHVRGLEILLEQDMSDLLDKPDALPFSVRPARPVNVETVKKILRTHYEGTSSDVSEGRTPHFMENRPICAASTIESSIVTVRHEPERIVLRRALGRPCVSPYLPWFFGVASVPNGYGGLDPEEALATHFSVPPGTMDWEDNAWFRSMAVQAAADLLWEEQADMVRERVQSIEDQMERELKMLDSQIELRMHTDPDVARAMMEGAVKNWAVSVREGMRILREKLGVLEGEAQGELDASASKPALVVRWRAVPGLDPKELDLTRCFCGPHRLPTERWSPCVSMTEDENGGFSLAFEGGAWLEEAVPCFTDLSILLTERSGQKRAGAVKARVRRAG